MYWWARDQPKTNPIYASSSLCVAITFICCCLGRFTIAQCHLVQILCGSDGIAITFYINFAFAGRFACRVDFYSRASLGRSSFNLCPPSQRQHKIVINYSATRYGNATWQLVGGIYCGWLVLGTRRRRVIGSSGDSLSYPPTFVCII